MAGSAPSVRRSATPTYNGRQRSRLFLILDVVVILSALAAATLAIWHYEDFRSWAYSVLGYGWIPVLLWVLSALIALRYRPRWMLKTWRWWAAGVAVAAFAVGVLSFFDADYGALAFVSLGGRWGSAMIGEAPGWAVLRLSAIALAIPLLVHPWATGRLYWGAVVKLGKGLWIAANYLALGAAYLACATARSIRTLSHAETRPRWITAAILWAGRLFSDRTEQAVSRGPAVVSSAAVPEKDGLVEPDTADGATLAVPDTLSPVVAKGSKWRLPPVELLAPAESRQIIDKPLKEMAANIERALADHGVNVEVADVKAGPRIVRFGLLPGWVNKRGQQGNSVGSSAGTGVGERSRVKVHSILAREKDLALAMSTPYLRFEPVPGETLLGLEVPSPSPSKVTMREILDSQEFRKIISRGGLPVALGADAGGAAVSMDLATLPHLMIAGATGSGKSVCINSIVASLLLTKPPDQLRMLMVDPKQVELTPFNGIPHLILPVITDVDEVSPMLKGLIREMTRRYKAMSEMGTRNIAGFNAKAKDPMPFLVLIVDELADLMMVGGYEIEQALVRLAQLGRAAGIHLVLATQRPSVKVVTGLLKANIPARIAFAVASQVDARVILDSVGAEKLMGRGDMLLVNSDSPKPRRVQGTLVFDEEIEELVEFWLKQKGPPLPSISMEEGDDTGDEDEFLDEAMFEKARELALRNPHLSASLLERRLKIGNSRASQIVEMLEEEGLVIAR